jgi:hypothetical protein
VVGVYLCQPHGRGSRKRLEVGARSSSAECSQIAGQCAGVDGGCHCLVEGSSAVVVPLLSQIGVYASEHQGVGSEPQVPRLKDELK